MQAQNRNRRHYHEQFFLVRNDQRACKPLPSSTKRVAQVSDAIAFSDSGHFKCAGDHTGITGGYLKICVPKGLLRLDSKHTMIVTAPKIFITFIAHIPPVHLTFSRKPREAPKSQTGEPISTASASARTATRAALPGLQDSGIT